MGLKRVWRPWVAVVCAVGLLAGTAPGAGAMPTTPDAPSDQDVRAAQAAVDAARSSVATMEVRLAQLGVELDDAWVAVERAAEDYTQSLVARDAASANARATAKQLEQAEADLDVARGRLVSIALKAMRTGSASDQLRAVLEAGGIEDLVQTSEALSVLGARTNEVVQGFRVATVVATTLRERATAALAAHESAAQTARDALAAAEDLQSDAEAKVSAAEEEREELLEALAAARQTSVEIERKRQERLDDERREREQRERDADRDAEGDDDSEGDDGGRDDDRDGGRDDDRDGGRDDDRDGGRNDDGEGRDDDEPRGGDEDEGGRDDDRNDPDPTPSPTPTPTPSPTPKPDKPKDEKPKNDPYGLGTGSSRGSASQGKKAVKWAKEQLGADYVYGGTGNPGFDCSGLTMKAWADAGVAINRSSRDQYRQVLKIERSQVRPGDLLFWGDDPENNDPASVTHVAMYIGGGQVIEAPNPSAKVRIVDLSGWRLDRIMPFAGRP